jgi:glycosyltransferase involved in cell wall biosynthesis
VVINDPSLPLVSIVTPSYNQGSFIRETIDSVLSQDYPNIEYWVIDGGSSDDTLSILKEYEHDPRFHWLSEKDQGQGDAINKGWSRCRGEIVAWLNSDDTYLTGAIQTQVQVLQAHPECGIVYGDVVYTDQSGQPLYTFYGRPYSLLEVLRLTIPIQPTTFIRRSLRDMIGPIDTSFRFSMDSEYWSRAARVTTFWYEQRPIATYRLHNQSKTVADYSLFYRDWLTILDNFFADEQAARRYQQHKHRLYADVYSAAAAIEAKQGSLKRAAVYVLRSIGTGTVRPRLLTVLPALVDRVAPFELTTWLVQRWTYLRSKRSSR